MQLAYCSSSVSSASLASHRTDGTAGVPARTFRGVTFFEAVGRRVEADTAPLLLEQHCCFHILDTDDGAALGHIRFGAVELIVRKFQPSLVSGELRAALLRLPSHVFAEILEADVLLVANEGIVFDFVAWRCHACGGDSAANSSCVERRLLSTTPSVPAQQHRESGMTGSLEARGLSSFMRSWERSSDLTSFHARQGCASATVPSCVFVCSLPGVYSPRAPSYRLM